ncbi:MAG: carboxylating nicotinate-nucleotide diphosphorylase [Proteobacteria bacterium]|nr:carboxylating nicotinate-nucleotide diphosphorylase [Pseudomonadota bacterium]
MQPGTPPLVNQLIEMALEEDLGRGDITCRLTVPEDAHSQGHLIAKQSLVVSGIHVFAAVMRRVDPATRIHIEIGDGQSAQPGDIIARTDGRTASLLMAERVALNFLQRLSGTATLTRELVDALPPDATTRLVDTRKTTPGMRWLEREAVRHGGGHNHRVDLSGGVLIKENHAAAAGGVGRAIALCRQNAPHLLRIEAEVRNAAEFDEALLAGADCIMLDNMSPEQMAECVKKANKRVILEASGGVSRQTVADIAATGVDIISVGAITHSAPGADISFIIDGVTPV